MFTVSGFLDGVAYAVSVGGPGEDPVVGSPIILDLLQAREGDTYTATPTGPAGTLDLTDPESVLGALHAWTLVAVVAGDAPDIFGPSEPGMVY